MKVVTLCLLDCAAIAILAVGLHGCGKGCDDIGRSVAVVTLDAETLDPVCAVIPPAADCHVRNFVSVDSEGRSVTISATGYASKTQKIIPAIKGDCAPGEGCNVVLLEPE